MHLRPFSPDDAGALIAVFRDAVRRIGPVAYTKKQVEAWARHPVDFYDFRSRLSRGHTLVMEEAGRAVAFGQLDPLDHLAFLYTAADYNRKGIGSCIYDALEHHACIEHVTDIHTEASRISMPFFAKKGYRVTAVEQVVLFGIRLERFAMNKRLDAFHARCA